MLKMRPSKQSKVRGSLISSRFTLRGAKSRIRKTMIYFLEYLIFLINKYNKLNLKFKTNYE